jgi:exonuclease III
MKKVKSKKKQNKKKKEKQKNNLKIWLNRNINNYIFNETATYDSLNAINIISFNTSGIKSIKSKINTLIQYVKLKNTHECTIICLQETHHDMKLIELLKYELDGFHIVSGQCSKKAGVITIVPKIFNVIKNFEDERILTIEITFEEIKFLLTNVYAEVCEAKKKIFWKNANKVIPSYNEAHIVCGDMNVLDNFEDTNGVHLSADGNVKEFLKLQAKLNLKDLDKKHKFTHFNKGLGQASRLDRFMASANIYPCLTNTETEVNPVISTYIPICTKLNLNKTILLNKRRNIPEDVLVLTEVQGKLMERIKIIKSFGDWFHFKDEIHNIVWQF